MERGRGWFDQAVVASPAAFQRSYFGDLQFLRSSFSRVALSVDANQSPNIADGSISASIYLDLDRFSPRI